MLILLVLCRMVCGISAGVLTLQEILNKTVLLSLSMAWQLGRAVRRAQINGSNILEAIVAQQNGTILIVGKVRLDEGAHRPHTHPIFTSHSLCTPS